jgi:hypothetical protein
VYKRPVDNTFYRMHTVNGGKSCFGFSLGLVYHTVNGGLADESKSVAKSL